MNKPAPHLASVLCLRVDGFAGKSVAEQARLRAQLEAVLAGALSLLPERDRVVLETPDGLAIVVLGNPVGALDTAQRCLDAAAVLPLAVGAHHGAVAPVAGHEAVQGMIGDGLRSAATAAGFAAAGSMLVTRPFREAVSQQSPVRLADLTPAGTFADESVHTHELFLVDRAARSRRRRRLLVIGACCVAGLGVAGFVGRLAYREQGPFAPPAELVFAIAPGGDVFVDGAAKGAAPPLERLRLRDGRHTVEVRRAGEPPFRLELDLKPGQQAAVKHVFVPLPALLFDIAPGGEVYVDGTSRGSLPALQRLELEPGAHTVEVRYGSFPPLKREVRLERGQQVTVRHAFAKPGVVVFQVTPGGQVFVDGRARGTLPGLKRLELSAGRHAIEVRFKNFPPLKRTVDVQAGQQVVIQHEFREKNIFRRIFGSKP